MSFGRDFAGDRMADEDREPNAEGVENPGWFAR
jgi:hypothetical protein